MIEVTKDIVMSSIPTPKKNVPVTQKNQSEAQRPVSSPTVNKSVSRPIFPSGRMVCDSQEIIKKSPTPKK